MIPKRIDPITGEEIPPYTSGSSEKTNKKFVILWPNGNLLYPTTNDFILGSDQITLYGEAPGGHTIEGKMFKEENGVFTLIQDWTSFSVHQEGHWRSDIDWDRVPRGESVKLQLLVRDSANKPIVKTVLLGRE